MESSLRRSETTRTWNSMDGASLAALTRKRLSAHIEEHRQRIIFATFASPGLGQRTRSLAASVFTNDLLDQLSVELETTDTHAFDRWLDAAPVSGEASFHVRAIVVTFAVVASTFAERSGPDADASAYLALRAHALAARFERRSAEPALDRDDVVAALLATLEARDPATAEHARVVGAWCARLTRTLGLSAEQSAFAERCGLLHDIGKVMTAAEIIQKPGPLDPIEWGEMHAHAGIGARILDAIPCLRDVAPIVRAHHERIDGKGYPDRLAGDAIPFAARIVAVADAFDAMASRRPYREALSLDRALDVLLAARGTQFDPVVVDAFVALLRPELRRAG